MADKKMKPPRGPSRLRLWWTGIDPGRRRGLMAATGWAVLGLLLATGIVVGMRTLRSRVLSQRYHGPQGWAYVHLAETPQWMPESLARLILGELTPPGANLADRELAQKVYDRAAANPWVRHIRFIQVRPNAQGPGGVVECHLDFRRPAARIRTDTQYFYVDDEGCHLPIDQVPQYVVTLQDSQGHATRQACFISPTEVPAAWRYAALPIHYVVLEGVASAAPRPGWKWPGRDLEAGLSLLRLVRSRSYYPQITVIDVRNHALRVARNQPEMRMYAQIGRGRATDIRFGRFPAPGGGDYVISPERKLSYLDDYAANHGGRLAGLNSYIDLRYDQLHVSIN